MALPCSRCFFGAGNVTFPLAIGLAVTGNLLMALFGLVLTAVAIPFSGLLATTLFEGDYRQFFARVGKVPGFSIILMLMCLIGPFGGLPRCITLTYSTLHVYFSNLELFSFSIAACGVIFLFSWKKGRIIDIIGYVLTPFLLLFLFAIVVKGIFFSHCSIAPVGRPVPNAFLYGLKEGYNTMDLLASFFFASLIYQRFKQSMKGATGPRRMFGPVFKASLIGAGLLSSVYMGFSFVAAKYSGALAGVPVDKLLGTIGHIVLGPQAGLVVVMSIALACLTTAIALAVISSEFLQKEVLKNKVRYEYCLIAVLTTSYFVASLGFSGIVSVLSPVLQVIYPALLALSLFNILHKVFNLKPVKVPVYAVFSVVLFNTLIR